MIKPPIPQQNNSPQKPTQSQGDRDASSKLPQQRNQQSISSRDLEALRDGDPLMYDKVYLRWRKPIHMLLLKLTGSEAEAEDIAQDVFVSLWTTREKIDPSKDIRHYLYLMARQSAIKYFRKQKAKGNYLQSREWDNAGMSSSDDIVISKELELLKDIAISRMPEYRRNIFMLSHNENLSNGEIAERLHITKETVYSQLSIARKQIKELIQLAMILLVIS